MILTTKKRQGPVNCWSTRAFMLEHSSRTVGLKLYTWLSVWSKLNESLPISN